LAAEYYREKKFPKCIGAIDGKHVRIRKPFHGGTLYYNYKHYNSIILLVIVDMKYDFLMIDVGSYDKNNDGGAFEHRQQSLTGRQGFTKCLCKGKCTSKKCKASEPFMQFKSN
jgi:hypothetical protein